MSFQNRFAAATRKPVAVVDPLAGDASRRWAKRKTTSNTGNILFDGITVPYVCTVRDISSTGARLEMSRNKYNPDAAAGFIPTSFTLVMPLDRTRVECQSMWRRGSFMGVRFLGAVETLPPITRSPMIRKK
jgi:hypothetical protein